MQFMDGAIEKLGGLPRWLHSMVIFTETNVDYPGVTSSSSPQDFQLSKPKSSFTSLLLRLISPLET